MNYIGNCLFDAAENLGAWWHGLSERTQTVACVVLMVTLIAIAGLIEGTAPSGRYYEENRVIHGLVCRAQKRSGVRIEGYRR